MANDLQRSDKCLDRAIDALLRAQRTCGLDARLKRLGIGRQYVQMAEDLIKSWRTGQDPKPATEEDDRKSS